MDTEDRRAEFVDTAFELFAEKGITHTSIRDITERMGVTRSLFYHYFDNKQDLVDAVTDERVDDLVNRIEEWDRQLVHNDLRTSLSRLIESVRMYLFGPESMNACIMREDNAALRSQFAARSSKRLAMRFTQRRAENMQVFSGMDLKHPYESFYLLCVGTASLATEHPEVDDDVLVDLVIDILRIEAG